MRFTTPRAQAVRLLLDIIAMVVLMAVLLALEVTDSQVASGVAASVLLALSCLWFTANAVMRMLEIARMDKRQRR